MNIWPVTAVASGLRIGARSLRVNILNDSFKRFQKAKQFRHHCKNVSGSVINIMIWRNPVYCSWSTNKCLFYVRLGWPRRVKKEV